MKKSQQPRDYFHELNPSTWLFGWKRQIKWIVVSKVRLDDYSGCKLTCLGNCGFFETDTVWKNHGQESFQINLGSQSFRVGAKW
ncbi:hypothetical protein SNK12g_27910 [Lactiplantibacillus plantarum]|jgi:hypothetical protein